MLPVEPCMVAEPSEPRGGSPPGGAALPGPEAPTLAERFIRAFRLPYTLACVVVGVVLFGIVDAVLQKASETSDPSRILGYVFDPVNVIVYLLVAYSFYASRYMREKLVEAKSSFSALLPDGEAGFRKAFAPVSSTRPQVLAWIAFLILLLLATNASALFYGGQGPVVMNGGQGSVLEFVSGIFSLVTYAVATLGLSSVVWTYSSISRGIHRFSNSSLSLRPYFEDAFLGLRPVGSLALSLASAYFGFIGFIVVELLISPGSPTVVDIIGVGGFVSGLILLGLAMFFLPLRRLHGRMIQKKHEERARLREKLSPVLQEPAHPMAPREIGHLFRLDMQDRKVSSMATWPFDVGIIGRLSVIAFSVTAILISRLLAIVLKI